MEAKTTNAQEEGPCDHKELTGPEGNSGRKSTREKTRKIRKERAHAAASKGYTPVVL